MKKNEEYKFIDSVVNELSIYCPQMSDVVMYWVACQFALESNFGNSRLAKVHYNFCGMKIPLSRPSTNVASSGVFAKYNSLVDCVIDYCYWLSWNRFNVVDLFHLDNFTRKIIASHYCSDSDYVDRVYTLFNNLKS